MYFIEPPANALLQYQICRACFNVQWCTKCAMMNESVQQWKAVFVMMNY